MSAEVVTDPEIVRAEAGIALAGFPDEDRLVADAEAALLGVWDDALAEIFEYAYVPGALKGFASDRSRLAPNSPVLACVRCVDVDGPFVEVGGAWMCKGCER